MKARRLQTRFVLAGCLLVAATIGSSLWSAFTLVRLSAVVDATLRESQETIDLSAELHSSLEREDDALLLYLGGDTKTARGNLDSERRRGDDSYDKLLYRLKNADAEERKLATELRNQIDQYRVAGDELLRLAGPPSGLEWYHRKVNPILRQVVAGCDKLREANFRSMRETGVRARDEAVRGTRLVTGISAFAVFVGIGVAIWLARSILVPVRELTNSVEDIRQGHFDRRVRHFSTDELGQLATGFNRMAEALSAYHRSNLGELIAAKTTLEATLNALPDAVLVFSPDGSIAALNPPARLVLAGKGAESATRLADIPFSDEHRDAIEASLLGRASISDDLDFARTFNVVLNHQPRRFLLTAIPIPEFTHGKFGVAVVLDDVTEFARLDELRSELIGVASHELKSPLTSLRMNLLMLAEMVAEMPARQQQLVTAAVDGCEELGLTIEELLDVTRIEAGQLRLNLGPVDLSIVLAEVKKSMQTRFDDAEVRLTIDRQMNQTIVQGDKTRLGSVFANVIGNALKYSSAGDDVTVKLVSGQNAHPGAAAPVQITVTDQGPGIPKEFRERVFEKFFRVEHHLTRSHDGVRGTGIGLYLCREIVKEHGGSITCESGDDESGTRIAISLLTVH